MAKDNSSLPLLLTITGAVVGVAVGGWFFLEGGSTEPVAAEQQPPTLQDEAPMSGGGTKVNIDPAAMPEAMPTTATMSPSAADVNLRKAQLAAGSDILIFPEDSSALHYYGLVLADEPDNAIARAERDTVLAAIALTVSAQLAAEEFSDAYGIAELVARQVPDHALVIETQQVLDDRAKALVDEAIKLARSGEDDAANDMLAEAAALPGRNPEYFIAVRESVTEIREVRRAAERDRRRRAQLANDQARDAWVEQVQGAIAAGNLIFPEGASAAELLTESNNWNTEREQLTAELRVALIDAVNSAMDSGNLEDAETLLDHTYTMAGGTDDLDPIRTALEEAFLDSRSQQVLQISDLTRVSTTPPRYPKHALEREVTGWVDVYFTVTPDGNTANIEVSDSAPSAIFNRAAVKAVADWQFEPVQYRGQIINQRVATRLSFELD